MKKTILLVMVAVMAMIGTQPAAAQLKFGLKAGVCIDKLSFNEDVFSTDNRAGFTGGAMLEFTVPLIGVGFDLSALYVNRSSKYMQEIAAGTSEEVKVSKSYIDIPLNLKYKIGIPGVSKVFAPFLTTGPDFAFLCGKQAVSDFIQAKKFDLSWNFGLGFEVLGKVQVAASYGLGLTKAMEAVTGVVGADIQGKNRYWTLTAAYLF